MASAERSGCRLNAASGAPGEPCDTSLGLPRSLSATYAGDNEGDRSEAPRVLKKTPQCIIPIYQRTYSWTDRECEQLWGDIVRAGSDW